MIFVNLSFFLYFFAMFFLCFCSLIKAFFLFIANIICFYLMRQVHTAKHTHIVTIQVGYQVQSIFLFSFSAPFFSVIYVPLHYFIHVLYCLRIYYVGNRIKKKKNQTKSVHRFKEKNSQKTTEKKGKKKTIAGTKRNALFAQFAPLTDRNIV